MRLSRSVNTPLPSGRNVSPQGASRFFASTWMPTSSSGLCGPTLGEGGGGRFGGLPRATSSGGPNAQPASVRATSPAVAPGARRRRFIPLRLATTTRWFPKSLLRACLTGQLIGPAARPEPLRHALRTAYARRVKVWIPHDDGLDLLGELPPRSWSRCIRAATTSRPIRADVEFWVPPFLSDGRPRCRSSVPQARRGASCSRRAPTSGSTRFRTVSALRRGRGAHVVDVGVGDDGHARRHPRLPRFVRAQVEHRWDYTPTDELAGKRVLVIGAGTIGDGLGRRLEPFDVELTWSRGAPGRASTRVDELPELLPHADVVVLIVPLTDATRGMVDADFLARMHDGALLVNAARGPVVRHRRAGRRAGFRTAPRRPGRHRSGAAAAGPPAVERPRVAPHPARRRLGGGAARRAYGLVREQIARYVAGEPLINAVAEGY